MGSNFPASTSLMRFTAGYVGIVGFAWTFKPDAVDNFFNPIVKAVGLSAVRSDPGLTAFVGPMLMKMATYYYNAAESGGDNGFIKYTAYGRVLMSVCWLINWYRGVLPSGFLAFMATELTMGLLTYKAMKDEKKW